MWKVPLLVSYAHAGKSIMTALTTHQNTIRILIDSGAYTAYSKGKTVDIDEYCKWLHSFQFEPDNCFMLDVIGNPRMTMTNFMYMIKKVHRPIPVFQRGATPEDLNFYCEHADKVAIGGLVYTANKRQQCKYVMEMTELSKPVHWLGFADDDFIKFYKPASCDTSTWANSRRYGIMMLCRMGKMIRLNRPKFLKDMGRPDIRRNIERLGYDIHQFKIEENWHGGTRNMVNQVSIDSWVKYAYQLEKQLGTVFYFVVTGADQVQDFVRSQNSLTEKGIIS